MELLVLGVVMPVVLLGLMLAMERVERPLNADVVGDKLQEFFETARPEEIETFVSDGYAPALDRYWRRRRLGRMRPGRTR